MPEPLAGVSSSGLHRLTQPDWCNAPQPGNWANACMRAPGHEGDHAVRKSYAMTEAFYWPAHGSYPVKWRQADAFPDLWGKEYLAASQSAVHDFLDAAPYRALRPGHLAEQNDERTSP